MDILHHRLQHQQISKHQFTQADDLVKWFGAMQAQDYAAAKWALALRLNNKPGDEEIEQYLTDGRIIRTHVLRPTWHFVHPEDIRWMLALTASRVKAGMASYERQLNLTPQIFDKCNRIIVKALEGGKHLTRAELMEPINKAGINTDENRSAHIAIDAELNGLICSGPGKTYALLDERIPPTPAIERDEALERLVTRYFQSHGPATVQDCTWWSGLTTTDIKRGITIAGNKLANFDNYWFSTDAPSAVTKSKRVFLLPNFDEYSVGYANREALTDAANINTRDNFLFSNIIVVNGKVEGTWKRTFRKNSILFKPEVFGKVAAKDVTLAAKNYAKFLDLNLDT